MNKFPRIDWRFTWIGLLLLTFFLRYFMSVNPTFTEIVYSRGLFEVFRWVYDFTLGLLPIPLLYLALTFSIVWVIWKVRKNSKREYRPWRNRLGSLFLSTLAVIGVVIFFFFMLWGFNYSRVPVERQLELHIITPSEEEIKTEALVATQELIKARAQIFQATPTPLDESFLPSDLESAVRPQLKNVLRSAGYSTPGRVRCRQIYPKGWMMRLGATGIYIPYLGEGHIDGGLHPLAKPFTMIHEMSHAYGFGDEGTANFLAYLSTESSQDPIIKYAGRLSYWRYAVSQLYSVDKEAFDNLIAELPDDVKGDWQEVRETHAQYPAFFPILFNKIYDFFLKSQGVKEGTMSYSRVVTLVIAWRKMQ